MSWFSKSLFILMLIVSSIWGISMNNMMMTWSFMEINLLSFIPLLTFSKNFNPHMMGLKYFLVQSLGSIFLLVSILMMLILKKNDLFNFFFVLSLLWKMGFPPFHFWLFSLMMELNWFMFFILSSWQKILPLYLINKMYFNLWDYVIILGLVICVLGAVFQTSIKKLMIFSSIFTSVWVISSMIYFKLVWSFLLLMYSIMLFFFIMIMSSTKFLMKESENYFFMSQMEKFYTFFILLSMAGVPPFLGFFMKISVLFILLLHKKIFLTLVLVISSIFMIFMYSSIFLSSLSVNLTSNKMMLPYKNYNMFFFSFIFLSGPMMFFMF